MKKFMGLLVAAISLNSIAAVNASAFSMKEEIQTLNKDIGHSQEYPIFIYDRTDIKKFLEANNLEEASEREIVPAIMAYTYKKFNFKMDPEDANELLPYLAGVNTGASAMPFFVDKVHMKMKYCVVLPSEPLANHDAEIKRILGADDQEDLFKGVNFEQVGKLMTTEEIQLFSLYHETSHCMDQKYLPTMYESEVSPYNVHKAEAFAEINALLMLKQRKDISHLAYPRSLIRTTYAKFYGPFLAQQTNNPFANPAQTSGGSIYFLAGPLMKAQELIEQNPEGVKNMSLAETVQTSQGVIDNYALSKLGYDALRMMFIDGRESTVAHYQKMAEKSPRMFGVPNEELLKALSLIDSVQDDIANYHRP